MAQCVEAAQGGPRVAVNNPKWSRGLLGPGAPAPRTPPDLTQARWCQSQELAFFEFLLSQSDLNEFLVFILRQEHVPQDAPPT